MIGRNSDNGTSHDNNSDEKSGAAGAIEDNRSELAADNKETNIAGTIGANGCDLAVVEIRFPLSWI